MAAAELLFPKLVVFGASGPSGLQVVQQAFEKGHSVTAVVRSPEKFELKTGIERIVCLTGIYTQKDPANPRLFDWFFRPLARSFINDMILMENILTDSNLCYTIVRPPVLTEGPLTESYLVAEGQSVPRSAWRVSRADLAHFMLKSLQTNEWDKKGMAIAGKK